METEINQLVHDYTHGTIDRRNFLKTLAILTGSTAMALTFIPTLEGNQVKGENQQETGMELITEDITYPGETGEVKAYLAHPKKRKKYPAVIVIHENRGLQPHIKDVNRRMAQAGFLSLAPDALSPLGGTPADDADNARTMMQGLDSDKTAKDFVAAVKYLKTHPLSNGNVGCTGFCWGGAMTNRVAVESPDLKAAVPYYGSQPKDEDVPKIKAKVLAHYAGDDERINKGIAAFEEAMKKAGIAYQIFTYEGTKHAFNNDSNPERYNEKAAKLAWERTIAFFKKELK